MFQRSLSLLLLGCFLVESLPLSAFARREDESRFQTATNSYLDKRLNSNKELRENINKFYNTRELDSKIQKKQSTLDYKSIEFEALSEIDMPQEVKNILGEMLDLKYEIYGDIYEINSETGQTQVGGWNWNQLIDIFGDYIHKDVGGALIKNKSSGDIKEYSSKSIVYFLAVNYAKADWDGRKNFFIPITHPRIESYLQKVLKFKKKINSIQIKIKDRSTLFNVQSLYADQIYSHILGLLSSFGINKGDNKKRILYWRKSLAPSISGRRINKR